MYATVAVKYNTDPTGTGFSKVLGSKLTNVGLVWEKEAAQQNASSKVVFKRKPPKIMKL